MWFRRKKKNHRHERHHVLDVKLRSAETRRARVRLATMAISLTAATLFGFYLFWRGGDWALTRFVYENPAFALQEFDVQTDGVFALEQLRRWSGLKLQDNLLALDLARVKRDLELIPAIKSAAVERVLPHTLRLRITEREPIAVIHFPRVTGNGYQFTAFTLDEEGYAMLPLDPRQRSVSVTTNDQLPMLTGIMSSELRPGRRIDSPQVHAALRLITAFDRSPMAGLVDLQRIDVSSPEVLQVITPQGNEVTFRLDAVETQLQRWRAVYDLGWKNNKQVSTLDLSVSNNVPVRWLEANAIVPVPARPAKSSPYKKKNV
jgi:cell division septal protein FtsQ